MPEQENKRNRKAERLLKEVIHERFTFEESQADLELLRSISERTYANPKPGEPSFHAYAAAVNATNEFAGHALDFPDLIPFNNQLADLQEKYMPSYPPVSPVTSAFFASWVVLDARDSNTGFTLGELLGHYLQHTGKLDYLRKAIVALNDSCCSFYEVTKVDAQGMGLWDIVDRQEFQAWSSSGYQGRPGEVWYVRLLPPFVEGRTRSVTMGTPYVFQNSNRRTWEDFLQRCTASGNCVGRELRDYLKYGKWLGYWLEFLSQAYTGYTGNMIMGAGVPDDPTSLPHFDPKHKL